MSDVGTNINVERGNWKFDSSVVDNFQEHIKTSVPLYTEGHEMICMLSDYFCENGSYVYDIGCSRGELIKKLAAYSNLSLNIIGIESECSFAEAASYEISSKNEEKNPFSNHNIQIVNESILDSSLSESSLITSYYTMQFIHPRYRQDLFDKIYSSLHWGGHLLYLRK